MIDVTTLPPDEKERLTALRSLNLLDTLPEERFDRITRLAKRVFNVPIAMVNLIDQDRMWVKSRQGVNASQLPRDIAMCNHTIRHDGPLIVSDTGGDSPFADNPLVRGDPHFRFYAGQAVHTADGYKVGTVCLMDFQPRTMSDEDVALLGDFAGMVEDELIVSQTLGFQKQLTQTNSQLTEKIEQYERSQQSLQNSEARYRALVENSPDVISVIDRNYNLQYVNASALRAGFTMEQLIGTSALAFVPPEIVPRVKIAFEKAFAGAPFASYEYIGSSGRYFETRLTPIREGDQIVGLTLVLTDISERHSNEEAQRRLARIIETTSDIVSTADLTGKITYLNAAGRKAAGISPDADLSTLNIGNFSPPAALEIIRDQAIPIAIRDGVWSGESTFYGSGGQELPGSQVIIAHKSANGTLLNLSTIVRDTSEQKRAADERERLLKRTDSFYQLASALTAVHDEREVLSVIARMMPSVDENSFTLSFVTLNSEQQPVYLDVVAELSLNGAVAPSPVGQRIPLAPAQFEPSLITQAQPPQIIQTVDDFAQIDDGTREAFKRFGTIVAIPLHHSGRWIGSITRQWTEKQNFTDEQLAIYNVLPSLLAPVLDNLRLVRTLEHTVKDLKIASRIAAENSRLKSEFLSTMSHELRTPLNAIEGFTSIMLSNMGIELTPRAENMVQRISANSKRLLKLINDFLDLSRIEAGRLEIAKTPFIPAELTDKWRVAVSVLAEEKGLDFAIHIDQALPSILYGDEEALSKIALNLLGNAFKFTKEGGVTLSLNKQASTWTIEVRDTGIGVPPHAREYIFEEFRQVDGSSKREYGGSGLGLSIVQKLARLMDGNISLESEVGVGSTFIVSLPLIDTPAETVQQAHFIPTPE